MKISTARYFWSSILLNTFSTGVSGSKTKVVTSCSKARSWLWEILPYLSWRKFKMSKIFPVYWPVIQFLNDMMYISLMALVICVIKACYGKCVVALYGSWLDGLSHDGLRCVECWGYLDGLGARMEHQKWEHTGKERGQVRGGHGLLHRGWNG